MFLKSSKNTALLETETYEEAKRSWETSAWNTEKVTNSKLHVHLSALFQHVIKKTIAYDSGGIS